MIFGLLTDPLSHDLPIFLQRYLEKVIKISQRPKHHKGFGFLIKGGKEFGMPITVDKVHLGKSSHLLLQSICYKYFDHQPFDSPFDSRLQNATH